MKTRRDFIKAAGALAASSLLVSPFGCTPKKKDAAATEGDMAAASNKEIGLQLYTLRNEIDAEGVEAVLEKVAQIGYKWVEAYGYEGRKFLGKTPQEFKSILGNNGLRMPSTHAVTEVSSSGGKSAIVEQMKTTAEDALATGAEYLVWAFLQEKDRTSLDDYKRHIETWNQFGQECKSAGIQFAYHNHNFEFDDFNGQKPYDMILANTDPELVKFELDLYWISKAGFDPVEYFNKAPGRYPMWHVKDMEPGEEKFFAEVGNGTLDFARIFAARETSGMQYFFVEQDGTRKTPFESIDISFKYLNQAAFV
ncbi:MAG TPA: sugar phosphate isomerase/epimerase [Cyclobacteriaceae bacterium]|nr:sugar phosphate isomerase/epimerase [Cyclobacteriaceae bacterium]